MNKKNLNLGTPLLQGGSHAVMPSLGHGTGLPYRERETPARAPINLASYITISVLAYSSDVI